MVDINPLVAMKAYSNTAGMRVAGSATGTLGAGEEAPKSGTQFTDFLKDKTRESIGVLEKSEEQSAKAVTGEADLTDVVEAVTNAELTLNTTVAIRDRMISAYQEIMRMPI